MSEKVYYLLFLGVILYQGILATLSDKDTRLSLDILSRQRRVINRLPRRQFTPPIQAVNFVVKIKEDARNICAGAILSHYTVITAALCISQAVTRYQVLSGSTIDRNYTYHEVTSKVIHYANTPHEPYDGLALVTVDPPFEFGRNNGYIELYVGPLHVGTMAFVLGWGFQHPTLQATEVRARLRTINLPIIDLRECQNVYHNHFVITANHICTYHAEQCCAFNDDGAPLIIERKLAGVHILKGQIRGQINPDVFIDIQRPDYHQWIINNTLLM